MKSEEEDLLNAAKDVIQARTSSILRRLGDDSERKSAVIRFLADSDVIEKVGLNLDEFDLRRVDLRGANLKSISLSRANLRDVNLSGASLESADLFKANFTDAKLMSAKLSNADLMGADLSYADPSGANFSFAHLSNANLSGANLSNADFSYANLSSAHLSSAHLSNAILLATDLSTARGLELDQLPSAEPPFLCDTKLPAGMKNLSGRDCDRLPQELLNRHPDQFETVEEAKRHIEDRRQLLLLLQKNEQSN